MKIALRADASLAIGSGHVMRCRSLAQVLRERGHSTVFVCREEPGNLIGLLQQCGLDVVALPASHDLANDATETLLALSGPVDWMIVDHYGLDVGWDRSIRAACRHVMAIDDMADRKRDCDLLLNQNLPLVPQGRYASLLPPHARILAGPQWALVRPEFSALREASLARRSPTRQLPCNLLIFLGGGDVANHVQDALDGALGTQLRWRHIDVVIGGDCPKQEALSVRLASIPGARLHVQTDHMAELMCAADVALTAGGSTSWEKCCLGLPSVVAVLSDNQACIAAELHALGAAFSVGPVASSGQAGVWMTALNGMNRTALEKMSLAASQVCTGDGARRVALEIEGDCLS